jgi:hypothetical protein
LINRTLIKGIQDQLLKEKQKVIVLFGPRQVGKTTLVNEILEQSTFSYLKINAEDIRYNEVFSSSNLDIMMSLVEDNQILFIDEAQMITDIGVNLKILHDAKPNLKIIVTGSSSFELANRMQEPLTGRIVTYKLFPFSIKEISEEQSRFDIAQNRNDYLLYGLYPEVYMLEKKKEKVDLLYHLASSYLYKDILQLLNLKHSEKLSKLLKLLALQLGSTVSINKLANALDMSSETVQNYIDLLEKSFVIFRLSAFSKNKTKEISKSDKIYFYDLGIRNALIENFAPISSRTDIGGMWENFVITERAKKLSYEREYITPYFWRTYNGAEIDYIEEKDQILNAFEIKYGSKKGKLPTTWRENYGESFQSINESNWVNWVY